MKCFSLCFFLLAGSLFCLPPLAAAGKTESTDKPQSAGKVTDAPEQAGENRQESPDTAQVPTDTAFADESSAETAKNGGTASSAGEGEKEAENDGISLPAAAAGKEASAEDLQNGATNSGTASPVSGSNEKEGKNGEPADPTFASIHSKGLTVADGNKWYYEGFDRQGRSSFAVLYEDGMVIEKTEWAYKGATRYPVQKKILRADGSETFRYDEAGRELSVERYKGKTLASKTENLYNGDGELIEQTITAGKNTDRSVWEFAGDKTVSQTKYRNGKKIAFIELHSTPHIVHLYVDDKEVYVGEEQ